MSQPVLDKDIVIELSEETNEPSAVESDTISMSSKELMPPSVELSVVTDKEEDSSTLDSIAFHGPAPSYVEEPEELPIDYDDDTKIKSYDGSGPLSFRDWHNKTLGDTPPWKRKSPASMYRARNYMKEFDKEIGSALANDYHGKLTTEDLDFIDNERPKIRKQINFFNNRIDKLSSVDDEDLSKVAWPSEDVDEVGKAHIKALEKRKESDRKDLYYPTKEQLEERKEKPESQNVALNQDKGVKEASAQLGMCTDHEVPLYHGECLMCAGEKSAAASNDQDAIKKEAQTPRLTFIVDTFIHAVCSIMINAKVSAGHNIEHVYEELDKKYKFTDEQKLEIIFTLRNMGYPQYLDISGFDFIKNYFA